MGRYGPSSVCAANSAELSDGGESSSLRVRMCAQVSRYLECDNRSRTLPRRCSVPPDGAGVFMRVSQYIVGCALTDDRFFILLHGFRGSVDKVTAEIGKYLVGNRGRELENPPWSPESHAHLHLLERGYITDLSETAERELLVEVAGAIHESDIAKSAPGFVFVPAYTCNLRCPYCFQPHEMHSGRDKFATIMTPARVDDAFRVIDRLSGRPLVSALSSLGSVVSGAEIDEGIRSGTNVGLFGGEPLAANTRDIVEYIHSGAHRRGLPLWAVTNGVQLELFEDLLGPEGIQELQITLDGMPEVHDRRRIGPGFRHTFDKILDNIDLALGAGAHVSVRMNIDQSNISHVVQLNQLFIERGWSDDSKFSSDAAVVTGEASHEQLVSHAELVAATRDIAEDGRSCVSSYETRAHGLLRRALANEYPFTRVTTCAAETGALMFDAFGDVFSCWEEIGQKERRVGTYTDGVLNLDEAITSAWLSRFPGAIDQCSECPYALIHTAGCANHARTSSGTIFAAACEGFQDYFPKTLANAYDDLESEILGCANPRPPTLSLPIVEIRGGNARQPAGNTTR